MQKVVILSEEEFKALNDNITDLSARVAFAEALNVQYKNNYYKDNATYYSNNGDKVTAEQRIHDLVVLVNELTEEESLKDSLYCEQRDLVQRLRDDLSKQNTLIQDLEFKIDELEKTNESMIDALDTIRYEANRYL